MVDVLPVYETRPVDRLPLSAETLLAADFITFTSGSAVDSFVALLGAARLAERLTERFDKTGLCSIGPVTSSVMRDHGLKVAVEAAEATGEALAAAVAAAV